jgi:hypothetical protein
VLSLLIAAYIIAVLLGKVAPSNRFSLNEVVLVGIVALGTLLKASPQWLDRVAGLKFGKLELVLKEVKDEVDRVGGDLEHLQLMLAVLLPELSQELLLNAVKSQPFLPVTEDVKRALRRLADQGLIIRRRRETGDGERHIGEIAAADSFLNTVALTERGREIATLILRTRASDEAPQPRNISP